MLVILNMIFGEVLGMNQPLIDGRADTVTSTTTPWAEVCGAGPRFERVIEHILGPQNVHLITPEAQMIKKWRSGFRRKRLKPLLIFNAIVCR